MWKSIKVLTEPKASGPSIQSLSRDERKVPSLSQDSFSFAILANPNANLTVLLIGNSFSRNVVEALTSRPEIKRVILIYGSGCSFPHAYPERSTKHFQCREGTRIMKKAVIDFKPDIVYIIQTWMLPLSKLLSSDSVALETWKRTFAFVQNHTSAVVINKGTPAFNGKVTPKFLTNRFYGNPVDIKVSKTCKYFFTLLCRCGYLLAPMAPWAPESEALRNQCWVGNPTLLRSRHR